MVMDGIVSLQYCNDMRSFQECKLKTLQLWDATEGLGDFTEYFSKQWLQGKFWRWQVFHSPVGYATTNNPCEIFNATIKRRTRRRRFHMRLLLERLMGILKTCKVHEPIRSDVILSPTAQLKRAANSMIAHGRVVVHSTLDRSLVCVRMLYGPEDDFNFNINGRSQDGEGRSQENVDRLQASHNAFVECFDGPFLQQGDESNASDDESGSPTEASVSEASAFLIEGNASN